MTAQTYMVQLFKLISIFILVSCVEVYGQYMPYAYHNSIFQNITTTNSYHVASNGSDLNDGLSPSTPFLTLSKINELELLPGDSIKLRGGDVFSGTIDQLIGYENTGLPIVITSYGTGKATIVPTANDSTAIRIKYDSHIKVHIYNLILNGSVSSGQNKGIYIHNYGILSPLENNFYSFIDIKNCTIKYFDKGIHITADNFGRTIISDIQFNSIIGNPIGVVIQNNWHSNTVVNNNTIDSATYGIQSILSKKISISNNLIRNTSSYGVYIRASKNINVNKNIFLNVLDSASVGLLAADSCIVEKNYFLNNDLAVLVKDYKGKYITTPVLDYMYQRGGLLDTSASNNNSIRFNIFKNNGSITEPIIQISGATSGLAYNNHVYNNTVVNSDRIITIVQVGAYTDTTKLFNNIFLGDSSYVNYLIYDLVGSPSLVSEQNIFWDRRKAPIYFLVNGLQTNLKGLITNQLETSGLKYNPFLINPFSSQDTCTVPANLNSLSIFKTYDVSIGVDNGLYLPSNTYSVPSTDFYDNEITGATTYNLGAFEDPTATYTYNQLTKTWFGRDTSLAATTYGKKYDSLITNLANDNITNELDLFYIFAAPNRLLATTQVMSDTFNITQVGGLTFTEFLGFEGNGTTGYLNTNWAPKSPLFASVTPVYFTKDNAHFSVYATKYKNEPGALLGLYILNSTRSLYLAPLNGSSALGYLHDNTNTTVPNTDSKGLFAIDRSGNDGKTYFRNGVTLGSVPAPSTEVIDNSPLFLLAANSSGSPANFSTNQISLVTIGASLGPIGQANLQTHVDDFMHRVTPLLPPSPVVLQSPANSATGIQVDTSFSWTPSLQTDSFRLEVADNIGFLNPITKTVTSQPTSLSSNLKFNTTYWWRVISINTLGFATSVVRSFTTMAAPVPTFTNSPRNLQLYARDGTDSANVQVSGQITRGADSLYVDLYKNNVFTKRLIQGLSYTNNIASFNLSHKIKASLVEHKFLVYAKTAQQTFLLRTVDSVVCGDAYLVMGQSNAWSNWRGGYSYTNEYNRTFGIQTNTGNEAQYNAADTNWAIGQANYNTEDSPNGSFPKNVGLWALHLQRMIRDTFGIPTVVINGAKHSSSIRKHLRNDAKPTDDTTYYGKALYRAQKSGLATSIKAIFWFQGETDGDTAYKNYASYFDQLRTDWLADYPGTQKIFVFQTRPLACSAWDFHDRLREVQRKLPTTYANVQVFPTVGISGYGNTGCHYLEIGYQNMAKYLFKNVGQAFYGYTDTVSSRAPSIRTAYYTDANRNQIRMLFDGSRVSAWPADSVVDGILRYTKNAFYLDGVIGAVQSGSVSGDTLILNLSGYNTAQTISYLPSRFYSGGNFYNGPWLRNSNGLGALSFDSVTITVQSSPFLAESDALFARSGSLTLERKYLMDSLIRKYKSHNVWDGDLFYMFAMSDSATSLLNWYSSSYTAQPVGTPVFTADRGFTFNGSTQYLRTQFTPNTHTNLYKLDSGSFAVYSNTSITPNTNVRLFGAFGPSSPGNSYFGIAPRTNDNKLYINMGDIDGVTTISNSESKGLFIGTRNAPLAGDTVVTVHRDGVLIGTSQQQRVGSLPSYQVYIGAYNVNNNAQNYFPGQISMFKIGPKLSTQQITDFTEDTKWYLQRVGVVTSLAPSAITLVSPINNIDVNTPVTFDWDSVFNALSYVVDYDTVKTLATRTRTSTNNTSISGVALTAGKKYYWRVGAYNIYDSTFSGIDSFNVTNQYTQEANNLFTRLTGLTDDRKNIIDSLIRKYKSHNVWDGDLFYMFKANNQNNALVNWYSASYTALPINTPTFVIDSGFFFNGSTQYLNTQFKPATNTSWYKPDSGVFITHSLTNLPTGDINQRFFGVHGSVANSYFGITPRTNDNKIYVNMGDLSGITTIANSITDGFFIATRNSFTQMRVYRDTVLLGTNNTQNRGNLPTLDLYIGAYNSNGITGNYFNGGLSLFRLGPKWTVQQMTDFQNDTKWYFDRVKIPPSLGPTPGAFALITPINSSYEAPQTVTAFTWASSSNATSYRIKIATDSAMTSLIKDTTTGNTTYTLQSGLSGYTKYWWSVIADNTNGTYTTASNSFTTAGGVNRNFYVALTGHDTLNSGRSAGTPFRSLSKINSITLTPGDTIRFNGGDTLVGRIIKKFPTDNDTIKAIVFKSYGTGRAIIKNNIVNTTDTAAIFIDYDKHMRFVIDNLEITGVYDPLTLAGDTGVGTSGIHFRTWSNIAPLDSNKISFVTIKNCVIRNFKSSGISIVPGDYGKTMTTIIDSNEIYDIGINGIGVSFNWHSNSRITNNHIHHIYGDTDVVYNHGILLALCKGWLIERNLIHDIGYHSVISGLGVNLGANRSTIVRRNEIYGIRGNTLHDAEAIDFENGSDSCIAEYNYIHNIDGVAGLISGRSWLNGSTYKNYVTTRGGLDTSAGSNNIFRYNLVKDAGLDNSIPIFKSFSDTSYPAKNNIFHNNTIVRTQRPAGTHIFSIVNHQQGLYIINNIVISDSLYLVVTDDKAVDSMVINNNIYWDRSNTFYKYQVNGVTKTIAEWRGYGFDSASQFINPHLKDPYTLYDTLNNQYNIDTITAYSPIDRASLVFQTGTSLAAYYGGSPPTQDYKGTIVPDLGTYDVGAIELPSASNTYAYTPTYVSWFARDTMNHTTTVRYLYDSTIKKLDRDTILSKLDLLYFLAAPNAYVARQHVLQNAFNLIPGGTLTFTENQGYKGNGSTGYLNTNWVMGINKVNYKTVNATYGFYLYEHQASNSNQLAAGTLQNGNFAIWATPNKSGDSSVLVINTSSVPGDPLNTGSIIGLNNAIRIDTSTITTQFNGYRNSNKYSLARRIDTVTSSPLYLLAGYAGSAAGYAHSTYKMSAMYLGDKLTSTQIGKFGSHIDYLLTQLGTGVRSPIPDTVRLLTFLNNEMQIAVDTTFRWSRVYNATSYTLEVSTDSLFTSPTSRGVTDTLAQLLVSMNEGTWYWYRVKSLNEYGFNTSSLKKFKTITTPRVYYVDSLSGNDANTGLATNQAWRTTDKVNSFRFGPWDTVKLKAPYTYSGIYKYSANSDGYGLNITSYGTGKARIVGSNNAIQLYYTNSTGSNNFSVTNLKLVGNYTDTPSITDTNRYWWGINILASDSAGAGYENDADTIIIKNCEISNFWNGISAGNYTADKRLKLLIDSNTIYDCGDNGIIVYGAPDSSRIRYNTIYNIFGSTTYDSPGVRDTTFSGGINFFVTRNALISRNLIYNIGKNSFGGSVGIGISGSRKLVVSHNEIYGCKGNLYDGDGIDSDWGGDSAVIQYNYVHNNDAAGVLLSSTQIGWINASRPGPGRTYYGYDYFFADTSANCGHIIRFNIFKNNARKFNYGAVTLFSDVTSGTNRMKGNKIYNNTFVQSKVPGLDSSSMIHIMGLSNSTGVDSLLVYNNIFIGDSVYFYKVSKINFTYNTGLNIQNNLYYDSSGNFYKVAWASPMTLDSWRTTYSQETNPWIITAFLQNPFTTRDTLNNVWALDTISAYKKLYYPSLITDNGVNFDSAFGGTLTSMPTLGSTDFYGSAINLNGRWDLGAYADTSGYIWQDTTKLLLGGIRQQYATTDAFIYDSLIAKLQTDSLMRNARLLYLFGAPDTTLALRSLKLEDTVATRSGTVTFTPYVGMQGSGVTGSNSFINTNVWASGSYGIFSADKSSIGILVRNNSDSNGFDIGSYSTAGGTTYATLKTRGTSNLYTAFFMSASQLVGATLDSRGFFLVNRIGDDDTVRFLRNNIKLSSQKQAEVGIPQYFMTVGAIRYGGTSGSSLTDRQYAAMWYGNGLTTTQQTSLYNNLNWYYNRVGQPTIVAGTYNSAYYVDALNGNDANDGWSPETAWQTIGKLNSVTFAAGDTIKINGGQTYTTTSTINIKNASLQNLVITSYGTGKPTLSINKTDTLLSLTHSNATTPSVRVRISNIIFTGPVTNTVGYTGTTNDSADQKVGVSYQASDSSSWTAADSIRVYIKNCEFTGFVRALQLCNWFFDKPVRYTIDSNLVYNNLATGIQVYGSHDSSKYRYNKIYNIFGTIAEANTYGINLAFARNAVTTRNLVYNIGAGTAGGIGIATMGGALNTFSYNEIYGTKKNTQDGHGIDLDNDMDSSIVEYNYVHNNDGAGVLISGLSAGAMSNFASYIHGYNWKILASSGSDRNVVRYNVFKNNVRASAPNGNVVSFNAVNTHIGNLIYNNTSILQNNAVTNEAMIAMTDANGIDSTRIYNNVFLGSNVLMFNFRGQTATGTKIYNNIFWDSANSNYQYIKYNVNVTTSIKHITDTLGMVPNYTYNPQLLNPWSTKDTVNNAWLIDTLSAFKKKYYPSSITDLGVNFDSTYAYALVGLPTRGTKDFYNTTLPNTYKYDIGMYEDTSTYRWQDTTKFYIGRSPNSYTTTDMYILDTLIYKLQVDSLMRNARLLYLLGAPDQTLALVSLKVEDTVATLSGTVGFTPYVGFQTNGKAGPLGFINININARSSGGIYTKDKISLGLLSRSTDTSGGYDIGAWKATADSSYWAFNARNNIAGMANGFAYVNTNWNFSVTVPNADTTGKGFYFLNRPNSGDSLIIYKNGIFITRGTQASSKVKEPPDYFITLGAIRYGGTGGSDYVKRLYSAFWVGNGLTYSQQYNLNAHLNWYYNRVGQPINATALPDVSPVFNYASTSSILFTYTPVIYANDSLKMYYFTVNTSGNYVNFIRRISTNLGSTWVDSTEITFPEQRDAIIRDASNAGQYYMMYHRPLAPGWRGQPAISTNGGVTFTKTGSNLYKASTADTIIGEDMSVFYNTDSSKYYIYFRPQRSNDVSIPYTSYFRKIALVKTTNFSTYTGYKLILPVDTANFSKSTSKDYRKSLYNMQVFKTASNEWWGCVNTFIHDDFPNSDGNDGVVRTELVFSRDGENWHRTNDTLPWISNPTNINQFFAMGTVVGNEVYVYTFATQPKHGADDFLNQRWIIRRYRITIGTLKSYIPYGM